MKLARLAGIILASLSLCSCLLTPGRFTSALEIKRDRSFTFAYAGEVILIDPSVEMSDGLSAAMKEAAEKPVSPQPPLKPAPESAETILKRRAIAEALTKEVGYRSAVYLGEGKYRVDYAMTGLLDRSFVYPFNSDAGAILPWLAIEVRKDGTVRVKAPAFGEEAAAGTGLLPSADNKVMKERQGSFTLTTDADLVMHNNEAGAAAPGRVVWRVTPTSKTVPTAVVRF